MSQLGLKNAIVNRIDYKEKQYLSENRSLEFTWKPFFEIDKGESSIFTHVLHDNYYSYIIFPEYGRDVYSPNNDEKIFLEFYKSYLEPYLLRANKTYLTNNVLLLYGDDWTFKINDYMYTKMEDLIKWIESKDFEKKFKFIYSTPSKYFNALKNSGKIFPERRNYDFFPYADLEYSYWTGFYTTRPYVKGLVRDTGKYLDVASRLLAESLLNSEGSNKYL